MLGHMHEYLHNFPNWRKILIQVKEGDYYYFAIGILYLSVHELLNKQNLECTFHDRCRTSLLFGISSARWSSGHLWGIGRFVSVCSWWVLFNLRASLCKVRMLAYAVLTLSKAPDHCYWPYRLSSATHHTQTPSPMWMWHIEFVSDPQSYWASLLVLMLFQAVCLVGIFKNGQQRHPSAHYR